MCSHINTLNTVQGPRLLVRQHGVALTSLSAADRDISLQQMEFIPGALDAQKGTNNGTYRVCGACFEQAGATGLMKSLLNRGCLEVKGAEFFMNPEADPPLDQ